MFVPMNIAVFKHTTCRHMAMVTIAVLLVSCSPADSELRAINAQMLAKSADKCNGVRNPAPGYAVACTNILRECQRRSKQLGYRLC